MTLDLGNISQTTDGESEKLSLQSTGNRFSDRRLSNTGGTNETDDLAFDGSTKLSDGEELQNPVLDILQTVVVLIQDFLGVDDRVIFLGVLAPWDLFRSLTMRSFESNAIYTYLGNPFQVVPRHVRLRSSGLEMAQLVEFFVENLLNSFGHLQLGSPLLELLD